MICITTVTIIIIIMVGNSALTILSNDAPVPFYSARITPTIIKKDCKIEIRISFNLLINLHTIESKHKL